MINIIYSYIFIFSNLCMTSKIRVHPRVTSVLATQPWTLKNCHKFYEHTWPHNDQWWNIVIKILEWPHSDYIHNIFVLSNTNQDKIYKRLSLIRDRNHQSLMIKKWKLSFNFDSKKIIYVLSKEIRDTEDTALEEKHTFYVEKIYVWLLI